MLRRRADAPAFATRELPCDEELRGFSDGEADRCIAHRTLTNQRKLPEAIPRMENARSDRRPFSDHFPSGSISPLWDRSDSGTSHCLVFTDSSIFIAGHRGLAGGAILRALEAREASRIIVRKRSELDLANREEVRTFFATEKPAIVVLAAAKVGGIHANNTYPVEFLLENLKIQNNVIEAAADHGVEKLLFLGSSCIYPKFASQPIHEDELLAGKLEQTNEAYAVAKISGITLCQSYQRQYQKKFICAMPTNLYGPGDNFDLNHSHVLPALLRKAHEAKRNGASELVVWGSGNPKREFLHCDDLAGACLHLLEHYHAPEIVNVGCGQDISIRELAETICDVVGFGGELRFDASKPDGTPRKLLDTSKITSLGWQPTIGLKEGIERTYRWFLSNAADR